MQKVNKDTVKKNAQHTFQIHDVQEVYYAGNGEIFLDHETATDRNYELGYEEDASKLTRQEVEGKAQKSQDKADTKETQGVSKKGDQKSGK